MPDSPPPPPPARRARWSGHYTLLGGWCPWSHVAAPVNLAGVPGQRCPLGCQAAAVEPLPSPITLIEAAERAVAAGRNVVGSWEHGDLAAAVTMLAAATGALLGALDEQAPVYEVTRADVERLAERLVADSELARVAQVIPRSFIPVALEEIVTGELPPSQAQVSDECLNGECGDCTGGPRPPRGTCILTGAAREDPDDCATHGHEPCEHLCHYQPADSADSDDPPAAGIPAADVPAATPPALPTGVRRRGGQAAQLALASDELDLIAALAEAAGLRVHDTYRPGSGNGPPCWGLAGDPAAYRLFLARLGAAHPGLAQLLATGCADEPMGCGRIFYFPQIAWERLRTKAGRDLTSRELAGYVAEAERGYDLRPGQGRRA